MSQAVHVRFVAIASILALLSVSQAGAKLDEPQLSLADASLTLPADSSTTPGLSDLAATNAALKAAGMAPLPEPTAEPGEWLAGAADPLALEQALANHSDKVPVEFYDRLQYALPDGTLRVIGRVAERTPISEAVVAANSVRVAWYEASDSFLALVLPDQFATLIAHESVLFLEPDFPLTYNLARSTLDVNARSLSSAGTGVWSWDATAVAFDSDVTGVTAPLTGAGVTAAIIDSGVDETHKDFSGISCSPVPLAPCNSRIVLKVKAEAWSGTLVQLYPSDALPTTDLASGHGTHVSGIVAGNAWYSRNGHAGAGADGLHFGVAPEASLVVVTNGDTLWAGMADQALNWVRINHATYGIKVTSNSWGCLGGCAYNAASTTSIYVKDLYDLGIVSVFAAGNDGGTGGGSEFSGYAQSPYVIGVAAHGRNNDLASFSSRGSSSSSNTLPAIGTWTPGGATVGSERRPDVSAPGVGIASARSLTGGAASLAPRVMARDVDANRGNVVSGPYVSMDGTSMATPHVTGAVVLLFDECPTATPLQVMRAIFAGADATAIKKTGSSVTAEPFEVGYGKLDVRASLDWIMTNVTGC